MSDHEEEQQPIDIVEPQPSALHYEDRENGEEYETDLAQEWLNKAREEGVVGEEEHVTLRSIGAVMKCAQRNNIIPGDLTLKEATILFAWWWGFTNGYGFHEFRQRAVMAQALHGIGAQMMDKLGFGGTDEEEETDDQDTTGSS